LSATPPNQAVLNNEADVELKFLYPLLTGTHLLAIPADDIKPKTYPCTDDLGEDRREKERLLSGLFRLALWLALDGC
jgi:hypothetical protein